MSAVLKNLPLTLRPMLESDLAEILAVERASYEFPWSEGIFADCLRVGYCCWVLQAGNSIGGYGIMTINAREGHILNLCVHAELRRQGHGRALLKHMFEVATKHRANTLFLEVRPSNTGAIQLYRDMGFEEIGVRPAYYPARFGREDALVLTRRLPGLRLAD